MKVGSLFSGIGGFELGLQMASPDFEISWQVEQDEFCQKILAKHWPDARRWDDVKTFPPEPAEDWAVDLICGGWPCQPVSVASSKRKGFRDDRWLWPEFLRICTLLRPRWVLGENVPGLLSAVDPVGRPGGLFGTVLRDMAALGYRVEYHCIPAASIGAPHRRDRVWIIGHLPDARSVRCYEGSGPAEPGELRRPESAGSGSDVSDADEPRLERHTGNGTGVGEPGREPAGPDRTFARADLFADSRSRSQEQWAIEPDVGRVAHGIPARVDRLRSLGNAVVPQVVEFLGRCIVEQVDEEDE